MKVIFKYKYKNKDDVEKEYRFTSEYTGEFAVNKTPAQLEAESLVNAKALEAICGFPMVPNGYDIEGV